MICPKSPRWCPHHPLELNVTMPTDNITPSDAITLNAKDSFGNTAATATIVVTVQAPAGQTFILTKGVDVVQGGPGNNTIVAGSGTLSTGDLINGGTGGTNTLELTGAGTFNLQAPTTLTNVQVITAQEGQAAYSVGSTTYAAQNQIVDLRSGLNATVDVSPAVLNPGNPKPATITIVGAQNSDVINLASGNDVVVVGSAAETVHGGTGNDTIEVTSSTIGASINGGSGQSTLEVTGGGSSVMGNNVVDISTILLESAAGNLNFIANATSGLVVDDLSSGADTVRAGGANQTLEGGAGQDTFVGYAGGSTTFENLASAMNGATISNFAAPNDVLFLTNVNSATVTQNFVENGSNTAGTLTVTDGAHSASMTLDGLFSASNFHTAADGAGTAITYH